MKTSNIIVLASISLFIVAFIIGPYQTFTAPSPTFNVSTGTPNNPTLAPSNLYYISSFTLTIAGVIGKLLGYWKDRHWKRKYEDVIVAKPL